MSIASTINEQTSSVITVGLADAEGTPAPPTQVTVRIDCLTTGTSIRGPQLIVAPGTPFLLNVTADENRIVDQNDLQEYRRLTIIAEYGNGDRLTGQFDWIIANLTFVT